MSPKQQIGFLVRVTGVPFLKGDTFLIVLPCLCHVHSEYSLRMDQEKPVLKSATEKVKQADLI